MGRVKFPRPQNRSSTRDPASSCSCQWRARSVAATDASSQPRAFKDAKRETARFYFARILPRTLAHRAAIESGAAPLMAMDADRFGD